MDDRLSTGIDSLDRALNGGVRPGSIVAVKAPPEVQSDPLLRAGMDIRPSLYVSTIRAATDVRETLERTVDGEFAVEHVGVSDPLSEARSAIGGLSGETNVILDAMNLLESRVDERGYVSFLNKLEEGLRKTGSVGVLHCLESEPATEHREITLASADMVWNVGVHAAPERLEFYLEIPRARAMAPDERILNLKLGRTVQVDTSRDIA